MAGNKNSGFASMSVARRRAVQALGGKNCQLKGTGHRWDATSGAAAGKAGGALSRGGRGRHADTSKPTHPRAK
jgi:hypothetical protein